jgi:hypothetical protein
MTYVAPYWSPSKFACWDQCPQEFYRRYVLREPMQPTEAMHFGTAVHRGLEAHFRGEDGELAFRRAWRTLSDELNAAGIVVDSKLAKTGLELVEKVTELGLSGEPERKIWVRTDSYLNAPLLGYVDLWCPDTHTIIDFKTTMGAWSAQRAEKEVWQPCLYSWVYYQETGVFPCFEYIVLNRVTGALSRFTTQRTGEQIMGALSRAREIAVSIEKEQFECRCRTGADCPECGAQWEHGHQCDMAKGLRIRLSTTEAA